MDKNILCKILNYWYMMDILTQLEHPYEEEMNYIKNKQKAARKDKPERLKDFESIVFSVTDEQKSGEYIIERVKDELSILNELRNASCGKKDNKNEGYRQYGAVTLYLGDVSRESCLKRLVELLNSDKDIDARPEKMESRISLALIQLNENGYYVPQSLSVSPILWSIYELKSTGSSSASSLEPKRYLEVISELDKKFTEDSLTVDMIWKKLKETFGYDTFAMEQETKKEFLVKCSAYFGENDIKPVSDSQRLSMSFYAEDLVMCKKTVDDDRLEDMTASYITSPLNHSGRPSDAVDLVNGDAENIYSHFDKILDVKNMPKGKWPSVYFPALMQQAAIDLETNIVPLGSIFSVNGPPGTGKTTLLKEVIVNNIVERAVKMYEFTEAISENNPDDMYDKVPFKKGDVKFKNFNGYEIYHYNWHRLKSEYDALNDYGVLVASCNNAAVENISKELPVDDFTAYNGKKEKDPAYKDIASLFSPVNGQEEMDIYAVTLENGRLPKEYNNYKNKNTKKNKDVYFSYYADALLNGEAAAAQRLDGYAGEVDPKTSHAWGLIAAPLGKRENLKKFTDNVLQPLISSMQRFNKDEKAEAHKQRLEQFQEARRNFKAQLDKVKAIQNELVALQEEERRQHENERLADEARNRLRQTDYDSLIHQHSEKARSLGQKLSEFGDIDKINAQLLESQSELISLKKEHADISSKQRQHEIEGNKKTPFGFGRKKAEMHLAQAGECKERCDELEKRIADTQMRISKLEGVSSLKLQYDDALSRYEELCSEYQQKKDLAKTKPRAWQDQCVNAVNSAFVADYLDKGNECCTKANTAEMRVTKEYDREREKLFFCALQLNKHFVFSSESLLENFRLLAQYWGFMDVRKVKGGDYVRPVFNKEDTEAFAPSLYQSLLMLVPVVSSTFASIGSMLRDVREQNVIGTLIIDEAGQATPECAVGALFRSRRAMIVGDPKQVEPVVTDDLKLLRDSYDDEELQVYKSKSISVQTFADSLNLYGTILKDTDEEGQTTETWVGCPLVVHRRCISPMFDISNELSYKIMKNQALPPKKEDEARFIYETSRWIDIDGSESGGKNHYVKQQGEHVAELIIESFRKSADNPSIYVISPFNSVVSGMKNTINAMAKNESIELQDSIEKWSKNCIGTVHRFQGKEAMEVFFLLGCDNTTISAVKWVNKNIVNVAVTRAKYRIYIVGHYYGVWSNNPNLEIAHEELQSADSQRFL